MMLTGKEADVLAAVELRAEMTVDQIGSETGYRSHIVRHALSHLKQRHIINRVPVININALGFTIYNFMFSLGNVNKSLRQALLEALAKAPEILKISELGSEYEYSLGICAKNVSEVANVLRNVAGKYENVLSKRALSTQIGATYLPRRYLSAKAIKSKPLEINTNSVVQEVDELDKKILAAFSLNGEATHPMIARQLGIPLSSLELRIKKLEQKKIIAGYIYRVSSRLYKMQTFTLLVQARGMNRESLRKLIKFSETHPAVVAINECFGSWDYELDIEVYQPEEITKLTQDLYDSMPNEVHSLRTLLKYRDVKFQFYPCSTLHVGK